MSKIDLDVVLTDATNLIVTLRAENEALKAKLAWRMLNDGTTHSESCHEWHWHCAMRRIADLEAKLARVSAPVKEAETGLEGDGVTTGMMRRVCVEVSGKIITHRLKEDNEWLT